MDEVMELSACSDCYQYAAGTLEGGASAQIAAHKRIARDNGLDDGPGLAQRVQISTGDGDGLYGIEPHFSWSPCEFCLSRLGGDRYPVVVILGAAS